MLDTEKGSVNSIFLPVGLTPARNATPFAAAIYGCMAPTSAMPDSRISAQVEPSFVRKPQARCEATWVAQRLVRRDSLTPEGSGSGRCTDPTPMRRTGASASVHGPQTQCVLARDFDVRRQSLRGEFRLALEARVQDFQVLPGCHLESLQWLAHAGPEQA